MSATTDSTSPVREPRPKRIKIDVACDICRSRKVKCDGARPACGSCSRRLETRHKCKYSQSGNPTPKRPTVDSLEPESLYHTLPNDPRTIHPRSALSSTSTDATGQPSSPLTSRPRQYSGHSPANQPSRDPDWTRRLPPPPPPPATVSNESPSVTDSMTAVVVEGGNTQEYFGSSSAGSFTAQIKRAIDTRLGIEKGTGLPGPHSQRPNSAATISHSVVNDAQKVLPTRRQADYLVGLYWSFVDSLYPFLDRPKWERAYRAIFDGSPIGTDEHIFLATLNIILAISTQLLESQSPSLRDESSRIYFGRAQDLVPLNSWEPGSIELVQYLLLASQYLQSTDHPHQTWMVVGSAVRIAQSLGLHLSESSEHSAHDERELLRTVWYGCVLMDRMVAVTHGRPAMISSHDARTVPVPFSSAHPLGNQGTTDSSRTDTGFFVKSVELYEIIHQTVRVLYHGARCKSAVTPNGEQKRGKIDTLDLGTVLQLDNSLSRWEQALPDKLKWTSSADRDSVTRRQAVILNLRFLHAKILLLRPVLASFCLAQYAEPSDAVNILETRTLRECALMCVSTAQDIISVLQNHQATDGTVGLLPAWWYRVYYVYTAATVLIAAKLRPEVFPGSDLSRAWSRAMSVLEAHEQFGESARRCGTALQLLSAKMIQDGTLPDSSAKALPTGDDDVGDRTRPPADRHTMSDDFANVSFGDMDPLGIEGLEFDVNSLSWLNDMRATWELLNHS